MGAFFLCHDAYNFRPALDVFQEMGFSSPKAFRIGGYSLFVYPKMAIQTSNMIEDDGNLLATVGTVIYKGLDYSHSLIELFKDLNNECLNSDELFGQYTIIYCRSSDIRIIIDPLGSKHVFTDSRYNVFSSHMLPICQSIYGKLHINKTAVYEKFLTGFIMSPNTIFEEILQIDGETSRCINGENSRVIVVHPQGLGEYEPRRVSSLNACLEEQARQLHKYFAAVEANCKDGVDLGLSGGYDSRLVLACIHNFTDGKIHLHSHSTENDHKKDLEIAEQMAEYVQIPCHIVKTKRLLHSDNVEDVLRKSVLYFDGRSSFSIGGCGEVYTAKYRAESTEKTPFTMTGVGGELYRNVFDIGQKKISFSHFMKEKVFSSGFKAAISNVLFEEVSRDILMRAAKRLAINSDDKKTKEIVHRYYCEIMMPDGQGVALDAYNQVSYCVAPFLEPMVIIKGYEAIPFHGSGGSFEGQLINHIDSGLASLPSSYGYPINARPFRAKVKESLRTRIPATTWEWLSRIVYRKNENQVKPVQVYEDCESLKLAYEYMAQLFPEINLPLLLKSAEDIRRMQFMAMTLFMVKERIETK